MKLRAVEGGGWRMWCPGCRRHHYLPATGWAFNGAAENPTFTPSFRITWGDGRTCHFVLTNGALNFCSDSTHDLAGKVVALPDLPGDDDS